MNTCFNYSNNKAGRQRVYNPEAEALADRQARAIRFVHNSPQHRRREIADGRQAGLGRRDAARQTQGGGEGCSAAQQTQGGESERVTAASLTLRSRSVAVTLMMVELTGVVSGTVTWYGSLPKAGANWFLVTNTCTVVSSVLSGTRWSVARMDSCKQNGHRGVSHAPLTPTHSQNTRRFGSCQTQTLFFTRHGVWTAFICSITL